MTKSETKLDLAAATVSKPAKKKRQFTWTEKRKAQFEKLSAANRAKREKKAETQKETVAEDKEEMENVHAQNILKRIMDPHYLSKSTRHAESKEDESSSSESESSSSAEDEPDLKKEAVLAPVIEQKPKSPEKVEISKSSKLLGKYKILKAKNKQLENLIINTKLKKSKKTVPEREPDSPEPIKRKSRKQTQQEYNERELVADASSNSFYFC